MLILCPAKINLFLKVLGKRSDSYHALESLLTFTDLTDKLEVEKSSSLRIEINGEFAPLIDLENNLFTKILNYFSQEFGIDTNLHIKLEKNIPVGGGLGGGSSNAAAFMKALNEIFLLKFSPEKLQDLSLNFGSDIAFFFEHHASIIKGRGEIIENFPHFDPILALLVNPKIHLSTKEIFDKFDGNYSAETPTEKLLETDVLELTKSSPNDLEKPAISSAPKIKEILQKLQQNGAEISKMSGSGSSCFGIFLDEQTLENAHQFFAKNFPEFFVRKIKILSQN
jgi:4-diphosphocytidyl-2-C-methyl-D-erythritol kinase